MAVPDSAYNSNPFLSKVIAQNPNARAMLDPVLEQYIGAPQASNYAIGEHAAPSQEDWATEMGKSFGMYGDPGKFAELQPQIDALGDSQLSQMWREQAQQNTTNVEKQKTEGGGIPWQAALVLGLMGAGAGGWLGAAGAPGGAAGGGAVGSGLSGFGGGTGLGGSYAAAGGAMDMGAGFGGGTAEALGLGGGAGGSGLSTADIATHFAGGTAANKGAVLAPEAAKAMLAGGNAAFGVGPGMAVPATGAAMGAAPLTGTELASLNVPSVRPMGQGAQQPAQGSATQAPQQAPQAAGSNASKAMGLPGQPPAPAAPGAAQPPQGITGNSFVDDIIGQFKKNALQIGLGGGMMMMAGNKADEMNPAMQQLSTSGQNAQALGNEYIEAARSGRLTAPQQASMDQYVQRAKNQIRQYFAGIGQFDSTARIQAEQLIDQEALAMQNNLIQTTLDQGLKALHVGQGPIQQVAQYQAGQDQALIQAMGNFAGGLSNLFGREASKGQVTQNTATTNITGQ